MELKGFGLKNTGRPWQCWGEKYVTWEPSHVPACWWRQDPHYSHSLVLSLVCSLVLCSVRRYVLPGGEPYLHHHHHRHVQRDNFIIDQRLIACSN